MTRRVEPATDERRQAQDRYRALMEDTSRLLEGAVTFSWDGWALFSRGRAATPKPNLIEVSLTHEGAHGFTLVCERLYEDEQGNRSYTGWKPKRLRLLATDANRMALHLRNLLGLAPYILD